ncbi:MAG: amidase family protein [Rhizomicrobium sp.]|nr:amidase family protein [Rhizomicrobium sp.]
MTIPEYGRLDATALAALVACKEVSAAELLEEAITRAERANPALNAIVYKDYARAREAAKAPPSGAFVGVPFVLKDISLLAEGTPTRQGSRFISAAPADHDSHLMTRFRAAGLIAFAKTNVPEFGLVPTTEGKLYGVAHNPWSLAHSTGGSSGGSAAAVAAGIVPMAHANDGGGSIRIPASACGLVGLKPTRGRISAGPDIADSLDGLAIEFAVTRSVRDSAALLDAVAGNAPGDPYSAPPQPESFAAAALQSPRPLRIAFTTHRLDGTPVHPDCAAAVEHTAKLCAALGHHIEEASPKLNPALTAASFADLWCSHLASLIEFIARTTGQTPGPDNLEGLTLAYYAKGKAISATRYIQAKMVLGRVTRGVARFHQRYDLWLTPTLGEPVWPLGRFNPDRSDIEAAMDEFGAYVPFTPLQNITGQPAIAVPLYWNSEGLPIGVQFAAAFGDETTLLQLATQLEQAQPWAQRYQAVEM